MATSEGYEVIISKRAAQLMVSHVAFLANESKEAADRLLENFEETAHSLELMPERFPWLNAEYIPQNKYRKALFSKRYLLIFQIRDRKVFVDYVVDTRQNYGWLIR